jgi:hypothetical protein
MWVVLVEATFKFQGVPEHLLGERQLTNALRSLAPALRLLRTCRGKSTGRTSSYAGLRVYNSVDEFDREYPQHTHLLDDYVGWLAELRSVNRGLEDLRRRAARPVTNQMSIYFVHVQLTDQAFARRISREQVLTLPDRTGVLHLRVTYVPGVPSIRLLAFERYERLAQFIWAHYEAHVQVQEALQALRPPSPPRDDWGINFHRDDWSDDASDVEPDQGPPARIEIIAGDSTDSDDEEREILLPPPRPGVEEENYSDNEEGPERERLLQQPQPRVEEENYSDDSDSSNHSDTESSWSSESPQR